MCPKPIFPIHVHRVSVDDVVVEDVRVQGCSDEGDR